MGCHKCGGGTGWGAIRHARPSRQPPAARCPPAACRSCLRMHPGAATETSKPASEGMHHINHRIQCVARPRPHHLRGGGGGLQLPVAGAKQAPIQPAPAGHEHPALPPHKPTQICDCAGSNTLIGNNSQGPSALALPARVTTASSSASSGSLAWLGGKEAAREARQHLFETGLACSLGRSCTGDGNTSSGTLSTSHPCCHLRGGFAHILGRTMLQLTLSAWL